MKAKLLAVLCGLSVAIVFAGDFNVAYVSIDRIMAEATSAKTIAIAIQSKYKLRQDQLVQFNQKIMSEESSIKLLQAKASSFDKLSTADKKTYKSLYDTYENDKSTFVKQYSDYQQQISAIEEYALAAFLKQIYQILNSMSKEEVVDLTLTSDQLIYAKSKYDITTQLLLQVNDMDISDIVKQIQSWVPQTNKGAIAK